MFSQYWPGDGLVGAVPVFVNSYPAWQSSVVCGGIPVPPGIWHRLSDVVTDLFVRYVWRKTPTRIIASIYALKLIWSSRFSEADITVRQIAREPSSRSLMGWGVVDRMAVSNPVHGENMYRALLAATRLGGKDAATLIELSALALRKRTR